MSISVVRSSVAFGAILVGTTAYVGAQTPPPANKPAATAAKPAAKPAATPTKPAATPTKPVPAKPVAAAPVTKASPARPLTTTAPAAPVSRATPGRPAVQVQTSTTATTGNTRAVGVRATVPPNVAAGGKGAAIGSNVRDVSPASNAAVAPSIKGRPAIPIGQTQGAVTALGNRSPMPTAANTVVPASSTRYLNSSSSSGRSPIPGYGSSAGAVSGGSTGSVAAGSPVAGPNGSLGTFQWGPGMITIYGCTRQGTQVLCDMDFNNQNQHSTQVNTVWWGDMYMVDQNGDRHPRASAYFVNGAGEPREVLDIPYGQSARYIMVFNDFSPNVATAGLHSAYGKIDIENMALDGSGGGTVQGADQGQAATAGNSAVGNSVNGMTDSVKNSGKQRAGEARDKAINKANDSLQKMMDKIPH
jgi:hypothetical protein